MIELACVVMIIGILAGISVPNYVVYVQRAKATEATVNLATIGYLQQVRILELGETIACEPRPEALPKKEPARFIATEAWKDLGFVLQGRIRYQYEVKKTGAEGFEAFARGDLDGDGVISEYKIDGASMAIEVKNAGE